MIVAWRRGPVIAPQDGWTQTMDDDDHAMLDWRFGLAVLADNIELVAGTVLGLAAGVLITALGGERGDQIGLAMVIAIGIGTYLTVASCAFRSGSPIGQGLIAPFATGAAIVIIGGAGLFIFTIGFFAVFFAVPAAVVLGAIYNVPWLSSVKEFPPEVQALIVQPFVYIWFILVFEKRLGRPEGFAPKWSARLERLRAMVSRLGRVSVSWPGAARVLGWLAVPINPWAIAGIAVAALLPMVPIGLLDYYAFGGNYSAVRPASVLSCVVGAIMGAAYGLFVGFAAAVAGGFSLDGEASR